MSGKTLLQDKKLDFLRYLTAFLIPVFVVGIVYKKLEISPFGNESILSIDLWGEYFPMYKYIFKDAKSLSDLLYTWNGGLGVNNLAQSAYYCNSIFFLVLKLAPLKSLITVLDVLCLIKFGFSALTCQFFLENKLKSKNILLVFGSVSYSLCGYASAYLSQCMWTDCIIYTPLIFYGLDRLMEKKKPLVYIASLAACMVSSFFISYSICLCIAIYFVFEMICKLEFEKNEACKTGIVSFKELMLTVVRFAVSSVLAAGIASIVLIPVAKCLGNAMVSDSEFPKNIEWYNNIAEYINAMLPETPPSLVYGIPNISTGIFMFLLVPLYFINKEVNRREKLLSAVYLGILYVAMDTSTFNYIWHGFVFPNQLPGRWSFVFSFFLVYLGMKGLSKIKGVDGLAVLSSLIIGVVLLLISQCSGPKYDEEIINGYMISLAVFAIGLMLSEFIRYMADKSKKKFEAAETALAEFAETAESIEKSDESEAVVESDKTVTESEAAEAENGTASGDEPADSEATKKELEDNRKKCAVRSMAYRIGSVVCAAAVLAFCVYRSAVDYIGVAEETLMRSDMVGYYNNVEFLDKYGKLTDCGDSDFYRVEANSGWTFNPGMIGDYKSVGYYSSTMMGGTFKLLKYFGNRVYADMRSSVYNITSPVQNSLFSIKYIIDRENNLPSKLPFTEVYEDFSDCTIRENPTSLPLAFTSSYDIMNYRITEEVRGIRNQNDFINKLMGQDMGVFEKIEPSAPVSAENAELGYSDNWNDNYFFMTNGQSQVKIHYTFTVPQSGAYFADQNFRAGSLKSYSTYGEVNFDVGADKFKYIGTFNEGDVIEAEAVVDNISTGCYGFDVYRLNEEKWQQCCDAFNAGGLKVTSFSNTKIKGEMTSNGNNMVFTSIPQDGGWKVYCDGEKLETSVIAETFLGFTIPTGTHEIVFRYSMPGLGLGTAISVICLITAVFYVSPKLRERAFGGLKKIKKKTDKKPEQKKDSKSGEKADKKKQDK